MSGGRATVRSVGDTSVVEVCRNQLRTRGLEGSVTDGGGGGGGGGEGKLHIYCDGGEAGSGRLGV